VTTLPDPISPTPPGKGRVRGEAVSARSGKAAADGRCDIILVPRRGSGWTFAYLLALILPCTACQQRWPEPGNGGMVEAHWPAAVANSHAPNGLYDRLNCTLGRLDSLREASARTGQYTGEIALLEITATKAKREYAGMLFDDTRVTVADLDNGIDQVNREMTRSPAPLQVCT